MRERESEEVVYLSIWMDIYVFRHLDEELIMR